MSNLTVRLQALALERQEKYPTVETFADLPNPESIDKVFFWGTTGYSFPSEKLRFLKKSSIVNIGNGQQTNTEVARDYITASFEDKRLRAYGEQAVIYSNRPPMPVYCDPGYIEDGVYYDLVAAYWNIIKLIGWDVDYFPNKWLIPGKSCLDFPLPQDKVARNSLVTNALPSTIWMWTGKHFYRKAIYKKIVNMGLWYCISNILNAIAAEAIRLGCIWINTDGYLLPFSAVEPMDQLLADMGLKGRIKESGLAIANAVGQYSIGNKVTQLFNQQHGNAAFSNVRTIPKTSWLVKQLQFCQKVREQEARPSSDKTQYIPETQ